MTENIPVGKCPDHGIVYGDDVHFDFPHPSVCEKGECGEFLETCTVKPREEVEAHVQ